jgi:hypothetical protein
MTNLSQVFHANQQLTQNKNKGEKERRKEKENVAKDIGESETWIMLWHCMFFIKTWGKTKGVTRIMKNIKQAKGNECN